MKYFSAGGIDAEKAKTENDETNANGINLIINKYCLFRLRFDVSNCEEESFESLNKVTRIMMTRESFDMQMANTQTFISIPR